MSSRSRTALVTGASGFIGGHLVRGLLEAGWRVHTCGRRHPQPAGGVEHHTVDLAEGADLGGLLEGITDVFHLAGASSSLSDLAEMRRSNVTTTRNLVQGMMASGAPPRLLYLSTSAVYGEDQPLPSPVSEAVTPQPSRPYGKTKWEAEQLIWGLVDRGLPAVVLRPVSVYGPGAIKLVASSILDAAIERRAGRATLTIPAAPVELRLVHIDDVVAACLHLISSDDAQGGAFNLADGIYPSSHHLGELIAGALGLGVELDGSGSGPTAAERTRLHREMLAEGMAASILLTERRLAFLARANRNNRLSTDALRAVGFTVRRTDLRSAIEAAVGWYAEHRWIL